jgi:hypothetical protein
LTHAFITAVDCYVCAVAPSSEASSVNATGPEVGVANLLNAPGDLILYVTCELELKIRSVVGVRKRRDYSQFYQHGCVVGERKVFSITETRKETFVLHMVLILYQQSKNTLVVPLGSSKHFAGRRPGKIETNKAIVLKITNNRNLQEFRTPFIGVLKFLVIFFIFSRFPFPNSTAFYFFTEMKLSSAHLTFDLLPTTQPIPSVAGTSATVFTAVGFQTFLQIWMHSHSSPVDVD